jgi:hypothetical protein
LGADPQARGAPGRVDLVSERDDELAREKAEIAANIWSTERGVPLPLLHALSQLVNDARPASERIEKAIAHLAAGLGRWSFAIVQCRICKAIHTATWEAGTDEHELKCYACGAPSCHPLTSTVRGPAWVNPLEAE